MIATLLESIVLELKMKRKAALTRRRCFMDYENCQELIRVIPCEAHPKS